MNLVYGRGEFSSEDVIYTAACLRAYSWSIIPTTVVLILGSAFYALRCYLIPSMLSIFSMLLNVSLNSFFVFYLKWGAISIAVATSLSALVNSILLAFFLNRKRPLFHFTLGKELMNFMIKISVCSGIAFMVASFLNPSFLSRNFFIQLLQFGLQATTFAVVFLGLSIFLK